MDVLEDLNLEPDQLDKFYDTLENLGVEIGGEEALLPMDDDELLPAIQELNDSIPAIIFHNFFAAKVNKKMIQMEGIAADLILVIEEGKKI